MEIRDLIRTIISLEQELTQLRINEQVLGKKGNTIGISRSMKHWDMNDFVREVKANIPILGVFQIVPKGPASNEFIYQNMYNIGFAAGSIEIELIAFANPNVFQGDIHVGRMSGSAGPQVLKK